MEGIKASRILVIGPTGAGKSQFCNFVQKDLTNSKNKVSDALESCTSDPFSNIFERNGVKYEFIDTAGNSDSNDKDEQNFTNLVTFLKDKKEIDFIFLLLKFGERITGETKKYINRLNRIFEENDFYTHLSIIFTKYPEKPKKKEEKLKDNLKEQISIILEETFNIKKSKNFQKLKFIF